MKRISKNNITKIATALKNGAVLILSTDTVYGLVCDAKNQKAVEKIFEIKKRDRQKTLPIFVRNLEMAKEYAEISKEQETIINKSWPGAVTFILKSKKMEDGPLSALVYKDGTIGLRVPKYKLLNKVLEEFGDPLAQTSANISGSPAKTKIKDVLGQLENEDVIVVDAGDLSESKPSKIVDLAGGRGKTLRY